MTLHQKPLHHSAIAQKFLDLIAHKRKYSCHGVSEKVASRVYSVRRDCCGGRKLAEDRDSLAAVVIASCSRKV